MAEYKYRALGWKDDDIASLNVVDGTADNQVELQITKQGAGTIDGPAIIGKDGITIDKAADSEKIEISGSGLVQKTTTPFIVYSTDENGNQLNRNITSSAVANYIPQYSKYGTIRTQNPDVDTDAANKKYVDDNYVKKITTTSSVQRVYGINPNGTDTIINLASEDLQAAPGAIPQYKNVTYIGKAKPTGAIITATPQNPYQCANKKYVDDNYVEKVKFANLEQALYGYILDTTEEAYADLDSAVLKNSVAVGNNVYPIADKTRALVTRIEGKTTKMVQLLDKSKFSATTTINGVTFTNNGDGTITVNGTATEIASFLVNNKEVPIIKNHIYCVLGSPFGGSPRTYNTDTTWGSEDGNGIIQKNTRDLTSGNYWIHIEPGYTANNLVFIPQLFDLTAMNREDITTVEQFKAEFPDLYPYENGNIYPAKISGVKFTGKNLINIPNGIGSKEYAANELPENIPLVLSAKISLKEGNARVRVSWIKNGTKEYAFGNAITASTGISKVVFTIPFSATDTRISLQTFGDDVGFEYSNVQIEAGTVATAYEPYTEPVSVTLPETYDLHSIGDYKDYLEITKNENNELYTLKKIQVIDKRVFDGTENWSSYGSSDFTNLAYGTASLGSKFINWQSRASLMNLFNRIVLSNDAEGYAHGDTSADLYIRLPNIATAADMKAHVLSMYEAGTPYIFYGAIATPVETVISTNLTYEQVTAIRHNGGLIEVDGNTNKAYARPTVTNTIVYRLTASATVDGTSIVKDTDGKIQLNQEYIDYLDNQLYQPPAISVFTMLDAAGAAISTSNELGTTLRVAAFNHQETNIKNIRGDNVELHINNAAAATTSTAKKDIATKVTLTTAQSITSSTKFTLKGTNTKGAAFSRDYQVNFYRYAYTATTDATAAPTSGATQQAAVSTFASNGSTFNYTKGAYIYFYTDNTGKKVQTNVLGQWADVDTTDMGKVTLTQSNGATHEYTCYRIGPFIETGSAKYRV